MAGGESRGHTGLGNGSGIGSFLGRGGERGDLSKGSSVRNQETDNERGCIANVRIYIYINKQNIKKDPG